MSDKTNPPSFFDRPLHVLVWALIFWTAIGSIIMLIIVVVIFARPAAAQTYDATVTRVIDGDTFRAEVEAWPGIFVRPAVRIRGIDTPEHRGKCELEKLLAASATRALQSIAAAAGNTVTLDDVTPDKFGGRVDADVSVPQGRVDALLIGQGHGRVYQNGKRGGWCDGG